MAWASTAPLCLSLRKQTCLKASFTVTQGHCPFFESSKLNINFLMDPTCMLMTTGTGLFHPHQLDMEPSSLRAIHKLSLTPIQHLVSFATYKARSRATEMTDRVKPEDRVGFPKEMVVGEVSPIA